MDTSDRLLRVALTLIDREGPSALTTRAVCERAQVSAPTLYHHFGDKDGLQRAVVRRTMADFLEAKRATRPSRDALIDLKRGWNAWVGFATQHPNRFRLLIEASRMDPEVSRVGYDLLHALVERLAADGRLRTDVETAARTIWAGSNGVLMLLLQGVPVENIRASSSLMLDSLVARLVA